MTDYDREVLMEGLRQIHAGAQHIQNNIDPGEIDLAEFWRHIAQAVVLLKRMVREEESAHETK